MWLMRGKTISLENGWKMVVRDLLVVQTQAMEEMSSDHGHPGKVHLRKEYEYLKDCLHSLVRLA